MHFPVLDDQHRTLVWLAKPLLGLMVRYSMSCGMTPQESKWLTIAYFTLRYIGLPYLTLAQM